jgi:hypothetical protein
MPSPSAKAERAHELLDPSSSSEGESEDGDKTAFRVNEEYARRFEVCFQALRHPNVWTL